MHFDDEHLNSNDTNAPNDTGPDNHAHDSNAADDLIDILRSEPLNTPRPLLPSRFRRARESHPTVFCIENAADRSMIFRVTGRRRFQSRRMTGWQVNFGMLNVQMNDLGRFIATYRTQNNASGRTAWQHTAQQIGLHLYHGLLNVDRSLAQQLLNARSWTRPASRLTLVFDGPRDYLSVPYELLHDDNTPLAVEHALCRRLAHLPSSKNQSFADFVDDLQRTETPLKVLLIAAGGTGSDSETEIAALYDTIAKRACALGLAVVIDVLSGADTRLDAVRIKLTQCPYHIVHYAGKIYHDTATEENSGLLFTEGVNPRLGHELLTFEELRTLLQNSSVQFFFVSAPISPQNWDVVTLQDRDYLDILAMIAEAGIPYALGFRWYVTATNKLQFANVVYDNLLTVPAIPERAVLRARQEIYTEDSQNETWASPLLIAQTPHGLQESDS